MLVAQPIPKENPLTDSGILNSVRGLAQILMGLNT